jgi:hypothetical protein
LLSALLLKEPEYFLLKAIIDSVIAEFAKKENLVDLNLRALEAGRAAVFGKKD